MSGEDWELAFIGATAFVAACALVVSFLAYQHGVKVHTETGPVVSVKPHRGHLQIAGAEEFSLRFDLVNSGRMGVTLLTAQVDWGRLTEVRKVPFVFSQMEGTLAAQSTETLAFEPYAVEDLSAEEVAALDWPKGTGSWLPVTVSVSLGSGVMVQGEVTARIPKGR